MTTSPISPSNASAGRIRVQGLPDLAFIGGAGSGKTTAAAWLVKHQGYARLSFGQPLRGVVEALWGKEAREDREKLQRLGMAVREIEPETWVDLVADRITEIAMPVVIDDCRFPNEWWALKGMGFIMVRVLTPTPRRIDRLKKSGKWHNEDQLGHVSETSLPSDTYKADYTVDNWQGTNVLEEQVFEIIQKEVKR